MISDSDLLTVVPRADELDAAEIAAMEPVTLPASASVLEGALMMSERDARDRGRRPTQ